MGNADAVAGRLVENHGFSAAAPDVLGSIHAPDGCHVFCQADDELRDGSLRSGLLCFFQHPIFDWESRDDYALRFVHTRRHRAFTCHSD